MSKEIEMKAELKDPEELRQRLRELNAKFIEKDREQNLVFDFPDKRLIKEDKVLRLRKFGSKTILTFKGPREVSRAKIKEEIETEVDGFENIKNILFSLGFIVRFSYEKNREVYNFEDVEIVIDEFPVLGWFCEIEAETEEAIEVAGKKLGIKNLTNRGYGYYIKKLREETGQEVKELKF